MVAFQDGVKEDNSVSYIQIDEEGDEIDDNFYKRPE